jgi:hypothetical protein
MMNIQINLTRFRVIFKEKTAQNWQNTEGGGNQQAETDFTKVTGDT